MEDVTKRIEEVLVARKTILPVVEGRIDLWKNIQKNIEDFGVAVSRLVEYAKSKDRYGEIVDAFDGYSVQNLQKILRDNVIELERVRERVSRDTINIGASGQARVGKSTLLQTISGLTDEQVPTGVGVPITAVRSQLFHSETREIAVVRFHDFSSFRKSILIPFYTDLNLDSPPMTMDEYESSSLSIPEEKLRGFSNTDNVLYVKLKEIKGSFWSYKEYLDGNVREIRLDELRSFVSYPTQKEEEELGDRCPRPYLSVKDIEIYTRFPRLQVKKICFIDLPGLGELTSGAEEHHVQGLQNEVDFVLLVKRPVEGKAYWRGEDGNAMNVLDKARGVVDRKDFVFILANEDKGGEELLSAMLKDILKLANEGIDGKNYRTLKGCCKDSDSVFNDIMIPVMEHLSRRLPEMDRKILDSVGTSNSQAFKIIRSEISSALQVLKSSLPGTNHPEDVLDDFVDSMRKNIAAMFSDMMDRLKNNTAKEVEDERYYAYVDDAQRSVNQWASEEGLGVGKESWIKNAIERRAVDKSSKALMVDEFNRIRVHISEQFCSIDGYFQEKIYELIGDIGSSIKERMGSLFEDVEGGIDAFRRFKEFVEATESCPGWEKAIGDLADLRINYRTHLHPRVRKCLDVVTLRDEDDYSIRNSGTKEKVAEELLEDLITRTKQAANEVKKSLIEEYKYADMVLYSAFEQFDDSLIRSGTSQKEFKRFARSYKSEIWPEYFGDIDITSACVARITKAGDEVIHAISRMGDIG